MKYFFIFFFLICGLQLCHAQDDHLKPVDSLYKEDQFYVGVTYNLIANKPEGLSQNGFSWGLSLGFIKDIPINKARNKGFGIGLGYASDSYNNNLFVSKDSSGDYVYTVLDDGSSFTKNKFLFHLIELPIEYRWRTSTPTDYAFWRIYTGIKFGYVMANSWKYKGDLGDLKYHDISDVNNFQYGLTLSAGYNTWNFHVNYLLNSIFSKNSSLGTESTNVSIIKIGLTFYIL